MSPRADHRTTRRAREAQIRELTKTMIEQQTDLEGFARKGLRLAGIAPQSVDVEDALSEAYLRAVARIRRDPGAPIGNLGAWYRKFLLFVCKEIARRQHASPLRAFDELAREEEVLSLLHRAAEPARSPELHFYAQELLELLDPGDRWILVRSLEGYTSAEIALEISQGEEDVTADAVRKRKSRALERLRRELGDA